MAVKSPKMSPISIKLLDAVEDGEWHDQEEVIDHAQYVIPPGEAFRLAQARAKAPVYDQHELIARGRRHRTVTALNALIANGRMERRENEDGTRQVRVLNSRTQVFVILSVEGHLYVHRAGPEDADVHVVDATRERNLEELDEELKHVKNTLDCLPSRMEDREEVEGILRQYYNDLKIDKLMAQARRDSR